MVIRVSGYFVGLVKGGVSRERGFTVLCLFFLAVFLGLALVLDWNRIGGEGFPGSFCRMVCCIRVDG